MYNGFYCIYNSLASFNKKDRIYKFFNILDNIETDLDVDIGSDDKAVVSIASFLEGFCGQLALYMKREYGYKIEVMLDKNKSLIHFYNVFESEDKRYYIDCRGITDDSEMFFEIFREDNYIICNDENYIKFASSYFPEDEISDAMINWLISYFGKYYDIEEFFKCHNIK